MDWLHLGAKVFFCITNYDSCCRVGLNVYSGTVIGLSAETFTVLYAGGFFGGLEKRDVARQLGGPTKLDAAINALQHLQPIRFRIEG